jgi:SAM-dependent methyltransferase
MGYHLKRRNIDYRIFHNTYSAKFEADKKRFLDEIAVLKPAIVGLSVITGRQAQDSAEFSILLKERMPEVKILWGGIHPTILPEQCMRQPYIDFVLQGEADSSICSFYEAFVNGRGLEDVPGCWWKEGGAVFRSKSPFPREEPENIGLDFSEIREWDGYIYDNGLSVITSRGCPFSCQFCVVQSLGIRKWRPFPMELVRESIDLLKSKNIGRIHINDDNFYVDFERAVSILEYAQLPSFSEIRIPTLVKDNRIKILAELKCKKVLSGGESCDDDILRIIQKGQTYEQMRQAAFLYKEHKSVEPSWSFIVGMPVETLDNVKTTIRRKAELEEIVGRSIGHIGIYMPYPGSPIYQIALEKGFREPQDPLQWGCIERYGRKGRRCSPDHEMLPWIDIKSVWALIPDKESGQGERTGESSQPNVEAVGGTIGGLLRGSVRRVKSIVWDRWNKNLEYRRLQARRSLPKEYGHGRQFVDDDLDILLERVSLSPSDRILDVGSRDGYVVEKLSAYCDCTGIELVPETAEYARSMGRNVLCQDMHRIKFPTKYFNGIIARHSLEHSLDFRKALSEFKRVLVPGGFLFLVIPIEGKSAHILHTQSFKNEKILYNCLEGLGFKVTFEKNIEPRGNPAIDYESIIISVLKS